jgi:lipopolysaccharide export system ATP-binding protein
VPRVQRPTESWLSGSAVRRELRQYSPLNGPPNPQEISLFITLGREAIASNRFRAGLVLPLQWGLLLAGRERWLAKLMETLIAEGIGKTYKGRQVVRGVDLKISRGEVVGLLGPNGAGKTTSFYMIVGLIPPETGRILVDDNEITRVPMYLRARNYGISYLPQEPSVFRKLTVEENILAVLEAQALDMRERRTRSERLITQLNLGHIRTTRGYALSGGERRRVEIARSLCIQPNFILLDEPFSGIDPIAVSELQKIIFDLKSSGIGILITDHNVRETLSVTDRAYIITEGRIFRTGTPHELGNDVDVRRLYLGEGFSLG